MADKYDKPGDGRDAHIMTYAGWPQTWVRLQQRIEKGSCGTRQLSLKDTASFLTPSTSVCPMLMFCVCIVSHAMASTTMGDAIKPSDPDESIPSHA